jgi:hypothetical protein
MIINVITKKKIFENNVCFFFIWFKGSSSSLFIERPCLINNTCSEENQYCRGYFNKRCVCQPGYRMNETTGMCEDINECQERLICDHYCINTLGSYHCSCHEYYQLKSDKHTCTLRTNFFTSGKEIYYYF